MALVASLAPLSNAIRAYDAEMDDDVFSAQNMASDIDLEGIAEDGSEALYYDPNEQVIYEILTDEEVAAEEEEEKAAAAAQEQETEEQISGEASNLSINDLKNMGIIQEDESAA